MVRGYFPIGGHASFTLWPASAVSIRACDPYIDGPLVATLDSMGDPGVLSWLEEGLFVLTTFGGVVAEEPSLPFWPLCPAVV